MIRACGSPAAWWVDENALWSHVQEDEDRVSGVQDREWNPDDESRDDHEPQVAAQSWQNASIRCADGCRLAKVNPGNRPVVGRNRKPAYNDDHWPHHKDADHGTHTSWLGHVLRPHDFLHADLQ